MVDKFAKKILFIGMSIISVAPITFFLSCSNQTNTIENQLLDLELKNFVQLRIEPTDEKLSKINLLNLGINDETIESTSNTSIPNNNNEQLANIFVLPQPKDAEMNDQYEIFYSWDFTKKDIVSFDLEGNIKFEVNVNVGLKGSNKFISKPKHFTINIEKTIITDDGVAKEASMYVYNGKDASDKDKKYKFQAIRQDIFDISKNFNIDFYSKGSILNNRPVVVKEYASTESAIDAQSVENFIEPPLSTSANNHKYNFSITSSDFDENNPRKGIYRIKVTPVSDNFFNSALINYAKENYDLLFSKFYYFHEINTNFQKPTESNISRHTSTNSSIASKLGENISNSSIAFMPIVKNPGLIIGKTAEEIIEINNKTPGGIFSPPVFTQQYSVQPLKPISIDISSVSASENLLTFAMVVKVGNLNYEMTNSINKIININQLV